MTFYIFLLYTVEPCYKASFRSQINVLWVFFFPFRGEVEIGWEGTMEDLNWERGGDVNFLFCSSWLEDKLSLAATLFGQ